MTNRLLFLCFCECNHFRKKQQKILRLEMVQFIPPRVLEFHYPLCLYQTSNIVLPYAVFKLFQLVLRL